MNKVETSPVHRFADRDSLASALADHVAAELQKALTARREAALVVAGGSTPQPFLRTLAGQTLAWHAVRVTLTDERWVSPRDVASNEGMVRRYLLQGPAARATLIGLKNAAATPEAGLWDCEHALASLPRPFDVVVLGMGDDGHIASLFPHDSALEAGLDPTVSYTCLAVQPLRAPQARMSLTLAALLDSRRIVLLITGLGKWQAYQRALQPGSSEDMPVRALLRHAGEQLAVYWAP